MALYNPNLIRERFHIAMTSDMNCKEQYKRGDCSLYSSSTTKDSLVLEGINVQTQRRSINEFNKENQL